MTEMMRKIVYYENILEYKENTNSELNLTELNNWQLCRTCLIETNADDVDMEKMCVMDAMKGRFLNVQEMLINTTGLELSTELELPLKVCKDCLGKITTLYYFTIQVRNAEKVLIRLAEKLNGLSQTTPNNACATSVATSIVANAETNSSTETNECFINDEEVEESLNDPDDESKDIVFEMDDPDHHDLQCLSDNDQTIDDENIVCLEVSVNPKNPRQNDHVSVEAELKQKNIENMEFIGEEELYLDSDSQDTAEIENHDERSKAVSIEEEDVILITTEQFEENSNTNDSQQLQIPAMDDCPTETVTEQQQYKHKQPRAKKRRLDDIKCGVCDQIFEFQRCLIAHVQQFHPSSKAFKCRECGMMLSHMQSLYRHMNTHKDKVMKNTCEFCQKSFLRVTDLTRHIRVHTGERPYKCSLCDKAFKQQGEMKAHQLTHYTLAKQLACDQCERVFSTRNGLYLHKKTHLTVKKETVIKSAFSQ